MARKMKCNDAIADEHEAVKGEPTELAEDLGTTEQAAETEITEPVKGDAE